MPDFQKGGAARAPFGKNEYLRSTKVVQFESYTCSKAGVPSETIDGDTQKVLQPGTIMCAITSTAEAGKVGAFDTTASDGRQTIANFVGVADTFLPWTLIERDVEISVCYAGVINYLWCFQYTAGVRAVLTTGVRDSIKALTNHKILFV